VIDNYDSFVHTLARYLRELGHETRVVRNDAADPAAIGAAMPSHLVLSPGPGTPDRAGYSIAAIRQLSGRIPILGVCLGHQAIGAAYGARICRARRPLHGEATQIRHDGSGLFAGLPNPLRAARYHSLIVEALPRALEATAFSADDEIMALRHQSHPTVGVQFHPESILTEAGAHLLLNFLNLRC
jgi:para-aminobenzoate synthetase component 2